jgi:hypothetical protein
VLILESLANLSFVKARRPFKKPSAQSKVLSKGLAQSSLSLTKVVISEELESCFPKLAEYGLK